MNGSREALFAFVQAVVDASGAEKPVVISPNPFYQIYGRRGAIGRRRAVLPELPG